MKYNFVLIDKFWQVLIRSHRNYLEPTWSSQLTNSCDMSHDKITALNKMAAEYRVNSMVERNCIVHWLCYASGRLFKYKYWEKIVMGIWKWPLIGSGHFFQVAVKTILTVFIVLIYCVSYISRVVFYLMEMVLFYKEKITVYSYLHSLRFLFNF